MDAQKKFEELYRDNREAIYYFLYRLLREEDTAQDILQDVFLNFFKIYQNRTLPDDLACRRYLYKIARNMVINYKKRAYTRKVELVPEYIGMQSQNPGPEEQVLAEIQQEEDERELRLLLGMLTEKEATALVLRYSSDMRLEDLAEVLEISISSASRLVQRASRKLVQIRHKLQRQKTEPEI